MTDVFLFLVPTLMTALLAFMAKASRQAPEPLAEGGFLMRFAPVPPWMLVFGALLLLVGAALCVVSGTGSGPPFWLTYVLVVPVLLWVGRSSLWERSTVVLVDDDGVRRRDWRGRHSMVAWRDLTDMRWSNFAYAWRFDGKNGQRVHVSGMLQGIDGLMKMVRQLVPEIRWRRWRRQMERFQNSRRMRER